MNKDNIQRLRSEFANRQPEYLQRPVGASTPPILHADHAYGMIVRDVLLTGEVISPDEERTDTGTIRQFGLSYRVDLSQGFPIITTKEVPFESVGAEYTWFLSGEPHVRNLQEKTSIWDPWADDQGHVPSAYGRYWRSFPSMAQVDLQDGEAHLEDGTVKELQDPVGVDQIRRVEKNLQDNPRSRRHVVSTWHPANALESDLPPCHFAFAFHVQKGRLHMNLFQRSGDLAVGVPFNMAGYALILQLMAESTGHEPGILKHDIVNAHIYWPHVEKLAGQVRRTPVHCNPEVKTPGVSISNISLDDADQFLLDNYEAREPVTYPVAV